MFIFWFLDSQSITGAQVFAELSPAFITSGSTESKMELWSETQGELFNLPLGL